MNTSTSSANTTVVHSLAPRLVRSKDAAMYLSIKADKLRNLVQAGEIPYVPGGNPSAPWLFDIRDLDRWVERSKIIM